MEGKLMKPKLELERPNEMFSQVLTPAQALAVRGIMHMVTEGGTASSVMAPVKAAGIKSGGKTGTAQKAVPVIDPKTGEPQRRLVSERDFKGNIVRQYYEIVMHDKLRSDAWYLSIAPLEKPVLAMAVLLEGPGPGISFYGGKNAGPIAAQLILKAKSLGYFGSNTSVPTPTPQRPRARTRPTP
jgi:cell division protein FtsI/penicillin-binding protein 2